MQSSRRPLLSLLLVSGVPGLAQAPTDLESELTALLNTPVQSASKRVQSAIESPQAIEVITSDQIRASGVYRLVDVLRLATSVQVWDEDPARANVTLRGVNPGDNPRTIQLLVDGVPLFNIQAAPIDFNGLPVPVDAIDRVEIVRGPSSSLYGANAQMGVIAITTRRPKEGLSDSLRAAGTDPSGTRTQAYAAFQGGALAFTVAGALRTNGHRNQSMAVVGFPDLSIPQDRATREEQVFARPELQFKDGRVWIAFGYGRSGPFTETGVAQPIYQAATNTLAPQVTFPDQTVVRELRQVGWEQTWNPAFKTEVKVNQKVFKVPVGGLTANPGNPAIVAVLQAVDPGLKGPYDFYSDRVRELAFQANWDPSSDLHFVFGGDTKKVLSGRNLTVGLPEERVVTASGGFLSVDWTTGPVTLSAGARAANETLGGSSLSPRASVVWKLDAASVLRVGYFTSTRSPMIQEKYAIIPNLPVTPTIVDPSLGLDSEEAQNLEVGYRRQWAKWSLDLTYFHTTLKKLIARTPTGELRGGKPVERYSNSPSSPKDTGVEASLTGELSSGWLLGLNLATADFKDPIYGLDQQADFSPKQTANLWTRYRRGTFFAYGALQHVGSWTAYAPYRSATGPTTVLRTTVDASTQVHAHAGLEVLPGLSVSVYAINAFKEATSSGSNSVTNALYALRNTHREAGLQAAWRF